MKCDESYRTPEWYQVKESLKGHWKNNPEYCLGRLKQYVGNIETATIDKLCVVGNYLTGSMFRVHKLLTDETNRKVSEFRALIFAEYKKRKIKQ